MSDALIRTAGALAQQLLSQSRYGLRVHECPWFLDVLRFRGRESLSQPWQYDITVTCPAADLSGGSLLLKPAAFTFLTPTFSGAPALPLRTVYGVIESFRRISGSADETCYALRLVPRMALLKHTRGCDVWLNQSVTEVVEQILRRHGLEGPDFEFRLSRDYPPRELITRWRETDLAFVQRLLAEVGIFWRYEMDTRLERDIVIFQDTQAQYPAAVRLPLRHPSGMSDGGQESIWDIRTVSSVVAGSVTTRDYNYRQALTQQESSVGADAGEGLTTGEVYHYAEPFLTAGETETPESGAFYARLRHERLLNGQHRVSGRATSPLLTPGQVLESDGGLPETVREGIVITGVQSSGSRRSSFRLEFEGIPYSESVCYRPPLTERPVISGSLPARVESVQKGDRYAWLDEYGRYRVRLDFDRSESGQGHAYLWLRMAKPYAGETYGWHAPLPDGTEVSVMFDGGDPDRPYIAYAQHDSEHPDPVTRDNHTRNVLRTPANNKLRMEDRRQEEHIKLATEYGKSQLNLGHLVDAQRQQRGSGFELRTDEHGALRAGKGLFLSADRQAKAQGEVPEMRAAEQRLSQANGQMEALNGAAEAAGALVSDISEQINLLTERLKNLRSAVLLASAPQGIALTSGEHLQLSSAKNTMVNAGQQLDIGAMKSLTVAVEKGLGLFVHKGEARVVANQGEVELQAQHNRLSLYAQQALTITSSEDEIVISTPKTLTLNGGGSYLKLNGSGTEHGTQGHFIVKAADYLVPGSGNSLPLETPDFKKTDTAPVAGKAKGPAKWCSE
jgi:type VI secretion system secreted protein VgrG